MRFVEFWVVSDLWVKGGGNLLAMGCIATDLRGGGPLDVGECAASTREGPLRGVQPLTCGGAVPCTQAAVGHHATEGWC